MFSAAFTGTTLLTCADANTCLFMHVGKISWASADMAFGMKITERFA